MKQIALLVVFLLCLSVNAQLLQDVSSTNLPDLVKRPFNSMDANVADIDNDGDLDIVLAIEFYKNVILLNDGNGN